MNIHAQTRTGEVARLIAERRQEIDNAHITDYDKVDDGEKIKEIKMPGPNGTTKTFESSQTALFQTCVSTTSDVEMLRLEAELLAEGKELDNPHIPMTEETLHEAAEAIKTDGHTPWWEQ